MSKQKQLRIGFAALGVAIAAALFAYLEITNYSSFGYALVVTAVILCPPSLISVLFIDAEPHSSGIAFVWLLIALINGALYSAIGAGLAGHLWKTDPPAKAV
jgi:hypothetical protein